MSLHHTLRTWWRRRRAEPAPRVMPLLKNRSLRAVFQPMVDLQSGAIVGHEALARAPFSQSDLTVERMLRASHDERCLKNFELECVEQAFEQWVAEGPRGQLFVNLSAVTLTLLYSSDLSGLILERMREHGIPARKVGLDVTDYGLLPDLGLLVAALKPLRAAGVVVALDDFKPSDRGMQAWAKVLPNVVKLAPRWTHNLANEPQQAKTVESLVRLTRKHDSLLVAKAVESEDTLRAVARLGVHWAQGYFLGSPDSTPCHQLNLRARQVLSNVA
ncbi:EAL domain-containing protein [Rhodoferax sp.]|uniref:EAL domain-containing protein n=1 Tax=Rhodoferax sp. TaxID=50421 RepID=UPI002ACD6A88|nr:EAL domain-containing protein [Rhodoferax sp.]MDZ7922118.1 EAL domain-containing protein [Rhodoferax sp.]